MNRRFDLLLGFLCALGVHLAAALGPGSSFLAGPRAAAPGVEPVDTPLEVALVEPGRGVPGPASAAPQPVHLDLRRASSAEARLDLAAPSPEPPLSEPAAVLPPEPGGRRAPAALAPLKGVRATARPTAAPPVETGGGEPAASLPPAGGAQISGGEEGLALAGPIRARYPMGARVRGEEGVVAVRVEIDESGCARAAAVESSSGYPALDEAARKASAGARFVLPGGRLPPASATTLTFRFILTE